MWVKTLDGNILNTEDFTQFRILTPNVTAVPFASNSSGTGVAVYTATDPDFDTRVAQCRKAMNYIAWCFDQERTLAPTQPFICDMTGNLSTLAEPVVGVELEDLTLTVPEAETVDFSETFHGEELTYAVTSSDTGIATASLVATPTTIAVHAIATGTATITLTATNDRSSVSTEFNVTVT